MRHRPHKILIAILVAVLATASPSLHAESPRIATRENAQALCEKAAALILSSGIEKAIEAFQDPSGEFIDRDLYVFVFDRHGKFLAHGRQPLLLGLNGSNIRDIHGTPLVRQFLKVEDREWVDYSWGDPSDGNKIKPKSSYIIHVGDYHVAWDIIRKKMRMKKIR